MSYPKPEPGLVFRYDYLWQREANAGRSTSKDRPACLVVVTDSSVDPRVVVILPITHSRPFGGSVGVEYLPWCGAILISTTRSAGSSSQKPMLMNGLMPGLLEFRIPMRRSPMASCRRVYSPRSRKPCSGTWTCAEAFVANRRTCLTTKTA